MKLIRLKQGDAAVLHSEYKSHILEIDNDWEYKTVGRWPFRREERTHIYRWRILIRMRDDNYLVVYYTDKDMARRDFDSVTQQVK